MKMAEITPEAPEHPETKDLIKKPSQKTTMVYRRRWLILIIYILYTAANSFQWMEYAIIASIVTKYYRVSTLAVDWTSIIYMAIYPFIVLPASYLIDKKGLRVAALLGGLATGLAAVVKVFSIRQDLFYVVLIGQAIGSAAQVLVLPLPAKIAAVWFRPNEVSTACSIAVCGTQLGLALGFQIPTILVKNDTVITVIGSGLMKLCWILAVYMIPVIAAIIIFFPRLPLLPPSKVQLEERKKSPPTLKQFLSSLKKLVKKNGFLLHSVGYGINIGVLAGISTFLNQFVLYYFPNCEEDAGRMGFLMIILGMVGSVLFGVYLDKSHRYKETSLFIYHMSAISVVGFALSLYWENKVSSYITAGMFGLFTNSYMVVGFEFAVELTFPSDESTATGIMIAFTQGFGVFITLGLGKMNQYCVPFYSLLSQSILLLIGAILTHTVPNTKRRQQAYVNNEKKNKILIKNV